MSEKTDIHAVDMVRRIRDEHAKLLRGKTDEEVIEFFRRLGAEVRSKLDRGSGDPAAA